mmetsp:Transcript_6101/g.10943  ORF Transcript_6101/g.10943 Transcript_6101/m.10943 type:complete len:382 (-) Transcript_6101:251-1396(-)
MIEQVLIFSSILVVVSVACVVYHGRLPKDEHNALNAVHKMISIVPEATQKSIFDQRFLRVTERNGVSSTASQGTAPMVHLEPVDDHIPWLHIPKTGTSFVNVLLHYACQNAPTKRPMGTWGLHAWEEYASNSEYKCSQEYSRIPFLFPSYEEDHHSFHAIVTDEIYKHNKGKLIGMLRDPKSHRMSLTKHKYLDDYGTKLFKSFARNHGLAEDDKSLSTFLGFVRGVEAGALLGSRNVFRYKKEDKQEQALVDLAKHRLTEGFQYIGITNRYPESVCLFYSKFAKPGDSSGTDKTCKPVVFRAVNTADSHVSAFNFTDADWDYFESYDDEIDREIYNHALELFEADLIRYGITKDSCVARGCWPEETTAVEKRREDWEDSG